MSGSASASTGVAKKIAHFEFTPPNNSSNTRLKRQDAIKRKNSNQSSSASSISNSTISSSSSNSDSEIQIDDFATSSSSASSSLSCEFSECYDDGNCTLKKTTKTTIYAGMSANSTDSSTSTSTSGIYQGSSGSDDNDNETYEMVSSKMEICENGNEIESRSDEIFFANTKHKLISTKIKQSLKKDCFRSLRHPFIPGHLQLVEFTEIQLDSLSQSDEEEIPIADGEEVEAEEPFYEELDNVYSQNQNEITVQEYPPNTKLFDSEPKEDIEAFMNVYKKNGMTVLSNSEKDNETLDNNSTRLSPIELSDSNENESLYSEPTYGHRHKTNEKVLNVTTDNEISTRTSTSTSSYSNFYNRSTNGIVSGPNIPDDDNPILPTAYKNQNSTVYGRSKSCSRFSLNTQDSWYDLAIPPAQLPPVPTSASAAVTKFSTIAKSAGKKLSKKLNYLRRLSRTGFEGTFSAGSSNSEFYSSLSLNQHQIQNTPCQRVENPSISQNQNTNTQTNSSSSGNSSNESGKEILSGKRSIIARPSIPPPEPPLNITPKLLVQEIGFETGSNHSVPPVPCVGVSLIPPRNNTTSYNDEDDIDDDDSDFYDSDSELIRNFVTAVQPIYSMEEEPLYQYYTYGISLQPEDNNYQPVIPKNLGLTLDMLVPRTGQRTLWCELPEVISSGILSILSEQQKKLQEAIFEILTSEVSYLKSLDVLVQLFYENDTLIQVLTPEDRNTLFGNISYVKDCAQSFLSELLTKWEESWYIQDVGQVINHNANHKFHVYKEYCRNKPYQDKILQKLRHTNDEFVNIIKTIEEDSKCQLLRMDSFLMLPMQRITRLPLLVNAIIQRTQSTKEKAHCEEALKSLTNLVLECNEAAKESQDAEETAAIFEKLEFSKTLKSIPSPGQFLLKGDFMKNPFDSGRGQKMNWTFQKNKKTFYWLLLFANQLFITKKKSSGKFEVLDMMSPLDSNIKPLPNLEGISKDFQHFFMLHFDRNESVYFLAARTQSEVERWKQNFEQLKQKTDLKVKAVYLYEAKLKDELSFAVDNVILVTQTQPDGWYYGKNINTEESGWFPGNYCVEC